ncbi:MAG: YfhO family protein, partial [Oscillospiraceae bacterium]|nr:YfhO family protein [Oscillospiraceae bacterium]
MTSVKRPREKRDISEKNKPAAGPAITRGRQNADAVYIASFLLPFLIFGAVFALIGIYPFGDRQYLIYDGWHQYYPFLNDFRHRLTEGGSFMWSWSYGIGGNYLPLFAYNLSSPLNLLLVFFPADRVPDAMVFFTLIKSGFAGLFTAFFLKGAYKRTDFMIPVFSACYALCAFTAGYYWNIMWFDTFALLPLVMYGLHSLVNEGRFHMYTAALFFSVFCNFY